MKQHTLILTLLLLAIASRTLGQTPNNAEVYCSKEKYSSFYLYYAIAGLGSNRGKMEPTLIVKGNRFYYTYEQNSYFVKRDKRPKRICKGILRTSSIDSIINVIGPVKDTTIFDSNPCIHSGNVYFLRISNGEDTIKYDLHNTFDWTALKIVDILDPYLPNDKRLGGSVKLIKDCEKCWDGMKSKMIEQTKK